MRYGSLLGRATFLRRFPTRQKAVAEPRFISHLNLSFRGLRANEEFIHGNFSSVARRRKASR
jgi:hypothetical protein